jgi:nucleoside-diphosphate-sugar epimerase
VTDKGSLEEAVEGKEYIFHCAGLTKAPDEQTYFLANAEGTKNLLEACAERDPSVRRFIYFSSQAAAGPSGDGKAVTEDSACKPITAYGRSKLQGEVYAKEFIGKLPVTIIRPSAVYGPRDKDIYFFFKMVSRGMIFLAGSPKESFVNLVYVADVVKAGLLAAENDAAIGNTYFATNPRAISWAEGIEAISQAVGRRCRTLRLPYAVMRLAGWVGEITGRVQGKPVLINREKVKEISQRFWLCSTQKIEAELGFSANYSLEEGASLTAQWYRRNGWL